MTIKLDDIDRRILHDLQEDGRLTNVELAKRCNISAPPCLRRVKQLQDAGLIESYHAVLSAPLLGYGVLVYAQVSLKSQSDADLREFESCVENWDPVRECYLMSGGTDYMLKIYARDWDDYQKFHATVLGKHPQVNKIQTNLTMRLTKNRPGIPIEAPHIPVSVVRSLRVVGS